MIQADAPAVVEAAVGEEIDERPQVKGCPIDLPEDFMVFDVETGPLPDDVLRQLCPPVEPPSHPGEFDPGVVRVGNLGPEKAAAKIEAAREQHAINVAQYEANVKAAEVEHFAKFRDRAALNATTGRVVAIGIADQHGTDILGWGDEAVTLEHWWSEVETCLEKNVPMVGFNSKHFDLPFLVRRSWMLGVSVPGGVRVGRYWSDLFIDLMEVWQQGSRELVGLDTLCAAFGLPGKVTEVDGVAVSGATFHELWKSDRAVAEKYLEGDLLLPAELARRMQVV